MFSNPNFTTFSFENIPLNRDVYLMDEEFAELYEKEWLKIFEGKDAAPELIGAIASIAVRTITKNHLEVSWYPEFATRFHEVSTRIPRDVVVTCVQCENYDDKPRIFIKTGWLDSLYLESRSIFALTDVDEMRAAIRDGILNNSSLLNLQNQLDRIATRYQNISFFSFADNVLLKSNWTAGLHDKGVAYSYEPEIFLRAVSDIAEAYRNAMNMEIHAMITQGDNPYYGSTPMHISERANHIGMNCLGAPFAQLWAIEQAARRSIAAGNLTKKELYLDETYFRSLRLNFDFKKNSIQRHPYQDPMSGDDRRYIACSLQEILDNLDSRQGGL